MSGSSVKPSGADGSLNPPLSDQTTDQCVSSVGQPLRDGAVAVIGMSCRFPGSPDVTCFWDNLEQCRTFVSDVPAERFGDQTWRGSFLEDIDRFDAEFFQISPRDAERMDPQQRLMLHLAWEAIEDAGYRPSAWKGTSLGVFVGSGAAEYADRLKSPSQEAELADLFPCLLPNRISQQLDVHGPSELTSAACTSSLVAVHRAVMALQSGECDAALAGGINLIINPDVFTASTQAGLLSPDGCSRIFDRTANGWGRGEGAGMLLLKPLSQALADGDPIQAVIRGTAVNHAGAAPSLLSPNFPVQIEAVVRAYQRAGVSPDSVSLVVAQGSGADAADAFELKVFELAFSQLAADWSDRPHRCAVACLKPNFGHLESAAGIASLCLAIQALKHRRIPGIAGLQALNTRLAAADSPFRLEPVSRDWERSDNLLQQTSPRRASVHNFGFGGTTAHLVLEEFVSQANTPSDVPGEQLILLSARGQKSLRESARRLGTVLQQDSTSSVSLRDLAWTLQVGREAYPDRLAVVANSKDQLRESLQKYLAGKTDADGIYFATVAPAAGLPCSFGEQNADRAYLATLIRENQWRTLAELWLRGLAIPWETLPRTVRGHRISLPTTPFAGDRYWMERGPANSAVNAVLPTVVHPLSHLSTIEDRCYQALRDILGMSRLSAGEPDPIAERSPRSLGLDSLRAMQLNGLLEREFQVALPLSEWLGPTSVRELAEDVSRRAARPEKAEPLPRAVADPTQRFEPFPLTDLQLAYFLGRADETPLGGNGCHLYWEWERPQWDVPRLEAAWNRLIQRHEMLRAVVLCDGQQQILRDVPAYRMEVGDLRRVPANDGLRQLAQRRERMSHERFATDQWPLFRLAVTQLPAAMRLHLSFDLLITDARSILMLLEEWAREYAEPTSAWLPPGLQFRDYVLALEHIRRQARYDRAAAYWDARIDALPPAPELPVLRELSTVYRPSYRRLEGRLPAAMWSRLREQFLSQGLTESTGLVSALAEVLARWSRSPHFTLVQTISQRLPVHPDIDRLVGDFTSTILLEVDHRRSQSFASRAAALQQRITDDLDQSLFSGAQVLAKLSKRQGGRVLMPVVFTSLLGHDGAADDNRPWDFLGDFVGGVTQTPQVTLDCQVLQIRHELLFSFDFVEDVFPPGLIEELFAAFAALLTELADDPAAWERTSLRLPSQEQRELPRLLPEPDELLTTAFLRQVAAHPERPAVISAERRLSYGELYQRAAALADRLQQQGAVPNQLVAVVTEKGWEQVVGVLAVLLTGAAYLPIDAGLPDQRISELLRIGGVRLAVTTRDHSAQAIESVTWIPIETSFPAVPFPLPARLACTPDDLAYVIFTSGSTGVPKGVKISHAAAWNTIRDINQRFAVQADDRVLALSALGFDLSVYDLFGLLAAGGALVLPDADRLRDAASLADLMVREQVTVWNSVPSYCQLLVDACQLRAEFRLETLRLVLLSGDWIPVTLPERIRRLAPGAQVISLGGATEASIWSIYYPIGTVDPTWASIPYGKPLANQQFFVLNDRGEDCPTWTPGELYIGGAGVALGYWSDEELTAARFPRHPETGERLYRTGDRGRWLPDGNIEFLGREDLQVKVGGHRVELGEIEAALSQRPDLAQAVIVVFKDDQQQQRLAGFYVLRNDSPAVTPADLNSFLKSRLPEYMIPSRWYACDAMPLTVNGKLDRKALATRAAVKPPPVAPRNGAHPQQSHAVLQTDVLRHLMTADEILKDPAARQTFVREHHGLRRDLSSAHNLPLPGDVSEELRTRIAQRRSPRKFAAAKSLRWNQVTQLLSNVRSVEFDGNSRFLYPSAGGAYALQIYLLVKPSGCEGLAAGAYYYHPQRHELQRVTTSIEVPVDANLPANQKLFDQAALALFLVADLTAIRPLYGDLSLDLARLEAGYMSQVLVESAAQADCGLCPIGYLQFTPFRELLRLSDEHVLLHTLLGGIPEETEPDVPPQNSNGSVTRSAAHGPLETVIADIWANVLQVSEVDQDANFFELGGNSFSVIEVAQRLSKHLGMPCEVTKLFQYSTVRSLATYLAHAEPVPQHAEENGNADVPLSRRERRRHIRAQLSQGTEP